MDEVVEAGELILEGELDGAGWPVTVLGDDDIGDAATVGVFVVIFLAVDEKHNVGVLLKRTGLTQMTELRALVLCLLDGTTELGERDDRHVQFTRQGFQ